MKLGALLNLGVRQARRDFASGEVRVLFAALLLAVFAVAAVSFITDRARNALALEANRLLGGDAVLRSDTPIAEETRAAIRDPRLQQAELWTTMSMLRGPGGMRLTEVRALDAGFPLRGEYRIRGEDGELRSRRGGPAAGELWLSRAGANLLKLKVGDALPLGSKSFRLSALVVEEPDGALDYFNSAPRVFVSIDDLKQTGLIQPGARINYRWVVAGPAAAVQDFVTTLEPKLARGQRLETAADARPELRRALDRADRFLGLAALIAVVLASVAVAMAARQHSERHLDGAAVLRCLGASQTEIAALHVISLLVLAAGAIVLGLVLAYGAQTIAGWQLQQALGLSAPAAGPAPALFAAAVGLTVLIAFALPPVLSIRRVPALRVLRRDLPIAETSAVLTTAFGLSALLGLLWWKSDSATLASSLLGGLILVFAVLALLAGLLIFLLRRARGRLHGIARFGVANLSRRAGASLAQIAAIGLGLTVLLLLTLVRTELLARWRELIPDDAPNRFVINIQEDQRAEVEALFKRHGLEEALLYPVVRGRLIAVNDQTVTGASYAERSERAQRLAEREFNLSALSAVVGETEVVDGKLWSAAEGETPQWTVEKGFAEELGWKVGDRIRFDLGGQIIEAPITSIRTVRWESFRPNFFVLGSPGTLKQMQASYMTSLNVPEAKAASMIELVERFPNLTVIDVGMILAQITRIATQVTEIVEVVFLFTLVAGILVLVAAIQATQDERLREGAIMRVLGARRQQVRFAQVSEFLVIGTIAGVVAAIAANGIAGSISAGVFELEWRPNLWLSGSTLLAAIVLVVAAGWFTTRRTVSAPPSETLRALS